LDWVKLLDRKLPLACSVALGSTLASPSTQGDPDFRPHFADHPSRLEFGAGQQVEQPSVRVPLMEAVLMRFKSVSSPLAFLMQSSRTVALMLGSHVMLATIGCAQVSEELYGIHGWPITGLVRIDRATGGVLEEHRVDAPGGNIYQSLAFDGSRFFASLIGSPIASYTVLLNPSHGFHGAPTMVAGSFNNMSIAVDPTTGRIWGVGQDLVQPITQVWEFDPVTGAGTSHGLIGGATTFATGITFDQNGTCYVTDAIGPRVMTLDLNTRAATVIGNLQMGWGFFFDIAMSLQGEIWGAFQDSSSGGAVEGLYRFDLTSFTPTLVNPMIQAYSGLGFARYPTPISVCPGKPNSQGCVPRIEVEGYPSATGNLGFPVRAVDVINQKPGMLLISVSGSASTPFGGGTLCLASPFYTTLIRTSSGNPTGVDCSGVWQLDLEQEIRRREHLGLPPVFSPGQVVTMQWVGRDGALGLPNPISLSGALSVILKP
jgi:hypothetical protein